MKEATAKCMCEWEEKEGEEKERKKREKKKKKQGEKEALQFYIYKLPIDRPAAVTGNRIKNRPA